MDSRNGPERMEGISRVAEVSMEEGSRRWTGRERVVEVK